MKRSILAAGFAVVLSIGLSIGLVSLTSHLAFANELDNESAVTNTELKGTVVLRVNTRTKETAFVQTPASLGNEQTAKALAKTAKFSKVPTAKMKSELDQDGGASSWYFYPTYSYGYNYNYGYTYYQPNCYWYGYNYRPYYTYSYGYYNYYYYGSW